jgi:hypothetical protein
MNIQHYTLLHNQQQNNTNYIRAQWIYNKALVQELVWENFNNAKHMHWLIIEHYHAHSEMVAKSLFQLGILHEKQNDYKTARYFFKHIMDHHEEQEQVWIMAKIKTENYENQDEIAKLIT